MPFHFLLNTSDLMPLNKNKFCLKSVTKISLLYRLSVYLAFMSASLSRSGAGFLYQSWLEFLGFAPYASPGKSRLAQGFSSCFMAEVQENTRNTQVILMLGSQLPPQSIVRHNFHEWNCSKGWRMITLSHLSFTIINALDN